MKDEIGVLISFMKKKLISFFICFTACFVLFGELPAEAYSAGIDDKALIFSESEKEALEREQEALAAETGWDIAVVTTDDGFPTNAGAQAYALNYYLDLFGSASSGVLYLIDTEQSYFLTRNSAVDYFNKRRTDTLIKAADERYLAFDDPGTVRAVYRHVKKYYGSGKATLFDNIGTKGLVIGFFSGLVAALIGVAGVFFSYKKHKVPNAAGYLDKGGLNYYVKNDIFVREYTTRTRIESSSSSGRSGGGGGGGRSGGGGSSRRR